MATMLRIPLIDGWQAAGRDEFLKLREAHRANIDWLMAFRHPFVIGLLRGAAQGRSSLHG